MAAPMEHMNDASEEKVVFPIKSGASLVKTPPVFSDDSRHLFCCSGPTVKVYSTVSGECIRELRGHTDSVTGLAVNPNNKLQLVSCSLDGKIIVWDYADGILLRKIPTSAPMFGLYTSGGKNKALYVLGQTSKSACVLVKQSVVPKSGSYHSTEILTGCSKDRRMTAVGPEASYFVRISQKTLFVKKGQSNQTYVYNTDYDQMTCVACHPRDLCIVTGCKDGKILIWYKFLSNSEVRSVLHWHSLPVRHLAFTTEGSYLMSGGHECVLVKWHYGTQYNDFLPRLGAPINHVVCSNDNTLYATTHDDNVIHVISSNFKIEHIFQGLTKGHFKSHDTNPIATGLLSDPRSRSLVLSGRPGHIQFYSVQEDKHLYNLDIVQQNYISPENLKRPLCVTEVTGAAFDSGGMWLATAEYWNDDIMSAEIRLKFWLFEEEKQSYILNTTVELPHDQRVDHLMFRPHTETSTPGTEHMLVTSSTDGKFKIWLLVDDTDIYRKNSKWNCESVGYYHDLAAGQVSFSKDGSLLAVVFGSRITLWEPEICLLKRTLMQNMGQEDIRFIEFGCHQCCQYLVSCTSTQLIVWDLVTCSVSWLVDLRVTALVPDPLSDVMAVFTDNKDLFVFKPSAPDPVFSHVAVSKSNILCGVFIPQSQKNIYGQTNLAWQNGSQLYFMNREQELRTVLFETDNISPKERQGMVTVEQNLPHTALSLLVSGQGQGKNMEEVKVMQKSVPRQPSGSYLKEVTVEQNLPHTALSLLVSGQGQGKNMEEVKVMQKSVPSLPSGSYLKEMLVSASHTLPSVTSLCQPFVKSLLISKQHDSKQVSKDDEEDEGMNDTSLSPWQHSQTATTDSGLDSDMETDQSNKKMKSTLKQSNVNKETSRLIETQSTTADKNQSQSEDSLRIPKETIQEFSDSEFTDLLAKDTDWYSCLKQTHESL